MNNHLTRIPINPNQQGKHELRAEKLKSLGAQDINTTGYQVFDLYVVRFYEENDQLDADAVFRPGIDTPFPVKTFDDLEIGDSAGNPIPLDEEEDKKTPLLQ